MFFVDLFGIYQLEIKVKSNKKLGCSHKLEVSVSEKGSFDFIEKIPRRCLQWRTILLKLMVVFP